MHGIAPPLRRRVGIRLAAALLVASALALLAAHDARAGGVNFNWGTVCYTEAPANLRSFACNTNTGTHPMTMSFVLDAEMTDMAGLEIEVEGISDAGALPDWWKLGDAGCRQGGIVYNGDNSAVATETCADWNGGAGYPVPAAFAWDGNRARVTCGYAIDASSPFSLPAGVEHYAGTLSVRDLRTVGTGACSGCPIGFTWWISKITVAGVSGRRDELTTPLPGGNQFLYWNRAARTPSALALVSAPQPSAYAAPVTLTATLTPWATGQVEFTERDSTLGTAPVVAGTATLVVNGLAEGDHPLTAAYGGNETVERAFAPVWTHTVTERPASTVTLESSPNPSMAGHAVQLVARIVPPGATGTVSFHEGELLLAMVPIQSDTARYLRVTGFSMGVHHLTASYPGDATHAPATSAVLAHTAGEREPTTVTFTFAPTTPTTYPPAVRCTAYVSPPTAGGVVGITAGGEPVENCSSSLVGGRATCQIWFRCAGTYRFQASYAGDNAYAPSASAETSIVVLPGPGRLTLGVTSPACAGQGISLFASIEDSFGRYPCTPPGVVLFEVDGEPLGGAVSLSNWTASLQGITSLAPGEHSARAFYSGGGNFEPCSSSVVPFTVHGPAQGIATVASSSNPSCVGQPVTLSAQVATGWPGYCRGAGAVQFEVDGLPYGDPVTLDSGTASLAWSGLAEGTHTVRVVYPGSAYVWACTSSVLTQVVGKAPRISSIRDVPNDDGGQVRVVWSRTCSEDSVLSYWVVRWSPESLDWEHVGTQSPLGLSSYSLVTSTRGDSLMGSLPYTSFMVGSRMRDGSTWYSPPDSGYSVDDLVPAAPFPFYAILGHPVNRLVWWPPSDPNVVGYRLYRGPALDDFEPAPEWLVSEQTGTTFDDPETGMAVYKVCAVDAVGHLGYFAMTVTTGGTAEVAGEPLAFGLERAGPNPARGGRLRVAFTLAEPAPATLQVLDVSGRRIVEREVGALGAGRHVVELGAGLAPGLYLVQLRQAAEVRVLRLAVLE